MKSETSFRVFFLKQHRKNSLKNIFSHQKVYFWISAFDHRAIVVPKMHIVHCHNFIISTQIIHPGILGLRCHKFILEGWCLSCLNCDGPLGGRNIEDSAFLGLLFLQLLKGETGGPRIIFQLRNCHLSSNEGKYFPPQHLLALCRLKIWQRALSLYRTPTEQATSFLKHHSLVSFSCLWRRNVKMHLNWKIPPHTAVVVPCGCLLGQTLNWPVVNFWWPRTHHQLGHFSDGSYQLFAHKKPNH